MGAPMGNQNAAGAHKMSRAQEASKDAHNSSQTANKYSAIARSARDHDVASEAHGDAAIMHDSAAKHQTMKSFADEHKKLASFHRSKQEEHKKASKSLRGIASANKDAETQKFREMKLRTRFNQ